MIKLSKVILDLWCIMNIETYIKDSIKTKESILNDKKILTTLTNIVDEIVFAYKNGNKVMTAGNGGSAGDAQHIAGELVSKFNFDRPPLAALELNSNSPLLTAISNDYGYESSFSRQILANGKKGDIFIAISTSGQSKNIIKAVETANDLDIITIGLLGCKLSPLDTLCKHVIKIPSTNTPIIQESQIMLGHIICGLVEERIFLNY